MRACKKKSENHSYKEALIMSKAIKDTFPHFIIHSIGCKQDFLTSDLFFHNSETHSNSEYEAKLWKADKLPGKRGRYFLLIKPMRRKQRNTFINSVLTALLIILPLNFLV